MSVRSEDPSLERKDDSQTMLSSALQTAIPQGRTLPEREWRRRHRAIVGLLWLHVVGLSAYGFVAGYDLLHSMGHVGSMVAAGGLALLPLPSRRVRAVVASLGLLTASAMTVHLAHGATEAHFHFFVMIVVIALYEDWAPFLLSVAYVVAQHGVMGTLDRGAVYDHPGHPWSVAAVHGGFMIAAGLACVATWRLNAAVREQAADALALARESESRFRNGFENAPLGIALIDASGGRLGPVCAVNQALALTTGRSGAALQGVDLDRLVHHDDVERVRVELERLARGETGVHRGEARCLHASGRPVHAMINATLLHNDDQPAHVLAHIEDITARKELERELERLADHDSLTGLVNRRRFAAELERHVAEAQRDDSHYALLVMDLDGFKDVNDSLGHQAGDELLTTVANVLRRRTRESDLVARTGGDEFAVLLVDTPPAEAEAIAEALVATLGMSADVVYEQPSCRVSASMGVVTFTGRTAWTADRLLAAADMAMYEAGEAGGDCFVRHAGSPGPERSPRRRRQGRELVKAALRDNRLTLDAQPILDLRTDRVSHYELLLRVIDENGRRLPPAAFMPAAERHGLIQALDRWVMTQALDRLADRRRCRPGVSLSVNVSAQSLGEPGFALFVARQIDATNVNAKRLVLELGETEQVDNVAQTCAVLEQLTGLGARVALDDYGSGHASARHLKAFPFDYLKIDGSFVRQMTSDPVDAAVVHGIVDLAQTLGKWTIGECVEDELTLASLRATGVTHAQGYHIARPRPADEALPSGSAPRRALPTMEVAA
jgi:diguanylate cyclase (GGDEF)-like protein/PAS domain S-box-containing protein